MDQPDHMIDMVIFSPVNLCPCEIRYKIKNFEIKEKAPRKVCQLLYFYNYKKIYLKKSLFNLKNLRVVRPFLVSFLNKSLQTKKSPYRSPASNHEYIIEL